MIRVNLLKSFGSTTSEALQQIQEEKNVQVNFFKKVLVAMLGVVALIAYELIVIPQLHDEIAMHQNKLNELVVFNKKKEALKVEIEKYEKDKQRLSRQTEFLDKIQKERLLTVELLTKIKELIPTAVWITSVQVMGKNVEIHGEAETERDINDFNLKLASSNFLKDVVVLSIELKTEARSNLPIKVFSLKATLAIVNSNEAVGGAIK